MNQIKPGDIVTGYHKGYHKVDRVNGPTVTYTRIDGKKAQKSCHRDYCTVINPDDLFIQMIKDAEDLHKLLTDAQES